MTWDGKERRKKEKKTVKNAKKGASEILPQRLVGVVEECRGGNKKSRLPVGDQVEPPGKNGEGGER
ncbi:hypothetical protein GHT06_019590 [Daphnia sinensis]|uniref:Uncharacterized protein n=1 Tax=Daphnia sinensis TaxID=1820382 RepID=A0AAD5L249_9CRUS|nr:hypothetical protein GHT06_019590 [Daphnia sinensis]